ncbi:sugar phosphate isomerase/epimerase [Bacillus sp. HNG]|uniref:sugar phosphate isomerase/epimerase family protein n=1 Tax=Bacillus sp. HNG TaxID=2293325 RepID=UPI000E2E8537|nr:sugar phosphate isomerase/epimerase family protein [Bacillus sp. HNG]RFB19276.1 sugar phosphate isomerase/epimerase [Bacillus sp. HNG]
MKYIISSYALYHQPIEKAIYTLLEQGWKKIEIMCEGHGYELLSWNEQKCKQLLDLLLKHQAKVQFHLPIHKFNPASCDPIVIKETEDIWNKCIKLAKYFHSDYLLCHPGRSSDHQKGLTNIQDFFNKKYNEIPENTFLLLENVPPYKYEIGATSDDLLTILSAIDKDKVGLCFDTGHAYLASKGQFVEELLALKEFIKGFHINDNHGMKDEHLALGDGEIPFDFILELIKEKEYYINFEMKKIEYVNQSVKRFP